jgi:metalloendopeptidase OMA1, mitochondrial
MTGRSMSFRVRKSMPLCCLGESSLRLMLIWSDVDRNKVFVFSGILPICRDDDGIATVLSHEIAHNICHHAAEQSSNSLLYYLGMIGLFFTTGYIDLFSIAALDIIFTKPKSRGMESEADQVGLKLMAMSCYDPRTASQFWMRMDKAQQLKPPEFLSTHPSDKTRVRQIDGWMEGAYNTYMKQDCSSQLSMSFLHRDQRLMTL